MMVLQGFIRHTTKLLLENLPAVNWKLELLPFLVLVRWLV